MSLLRESFREEFDQQLNQMRRITSHGPSIGRFIEHLMLKLLKKYLPKSVEFTSGFVQGVDVQSTCSHQVDIICYDRQNFPVLFDIEEFKVIPAKAVKGLIEIKSKLTKQQLRNILTTSCNHGLNEVPLESKMYILSISSNITPKAAFNVIKEFYSNKPQINKFFSAIYSLDWNEIIICPIKKDDNEINVEFIRLSNPELNDIATFIGQLVIDLYDAKTFTSICNHLGPSLFYPLESFKFSMYTKIPNQEDAPDQEHVW